MPQYRGDDSRNDIERTWQVAVRLLDRLCDRESDADEEGKCGTHGS
jgi:hypothetical protein